MDLSATSFPVFEPQELVSINQSCTWHNALAFLNWIPVINQVIIPALALGSVYWAPLRYETTIFSVLYGIQGGIGITAGYHRLWSHRAYKASLQLKIYLAAIGSSAGQHPILWWAVKHRAHHQYTDMDEDPYSVKKGLFHAHMGWNMLKQRHENVPRINVADLCRDGVVCWQYRHYALCEITMAYLLPILVCGLGWNDWLGGLVYGAIIRKFVVCQLTFCVNSLAHWYGDQPHGDDKTPRDNALLAFITLGEGYHNYHHKFPSDYRNGIEWYHFDLTKWMIEIWYHLGLASGLNQFSKDVIEKSGVMKTSKEE